MDLNIRCNNGYNVGICMNMLQLNMGDMLQMFVKHGAQSIGHHMKLGFLQQIPGSERVGRFSTQLGHI